jgi:8-oxo-dGTP pyrophosphatase MutT (NUDIX family)
MQSSNIIEHRSYGIICVHETADEPLYLLVEHMHGDHWAFSKGTPEEGETPLQTAVRELGEEANVRDVHLSDDVSFSEEYSYVTADGKNVHKINTYFLGFVDDTTTAAALLPDEIVQVAWLPYAAARDRLTFPQAKTLLDEVRTHILTKYKK